MTFQMVGVLILLLVAEPTPPTRVLGARGFRYSGSALAAASNPSAKTLSVVTSRGELIHFQAETGELKDRRLLSLKKPWLAGLSADGSLVSVADERGRLVIETANGKSAAFELGTEFRPRCIAATTAGEPRVVICGTAEDGAKPIVFSGPDFGTRRELYLFIRPPDQVAFSPSGNRMLFGGDRGVVVVGRKPIEEWEWRETAPSGAALRTCFLDDSRVALVDRWGVLHRWEYEQEREPRPVRPDKSFFDVGLAGRPDRFVALRQQYVPASKHGRSQSVVIGVGDGHTLAECQDVGAAEIPCTPLGASAFAIIGSGAVRRFSNETGKRLDSPDEADVQVFALDAAPDGTLGVGYADGSFRLFQPPNFDATLTAPPKDVRPISGVYSSDDGQTWVVGRGSAYLTPSPGDRADIYDLSTRTWTRMAFEGGEFTAHPSTDRSELLLQSRRWGQNNFGDENAHSPIRRLNLKSRQIEDVPTALTAIIGPVAWSRERRLLAADSNALTRRTAFGAAEIAFYDKAGTAVGRTSASDGELIGITFRADGNALVVCQAVAKRGERAVDDQRSLTEGLVAVHAVPTGGVLSSLRLPGRPRWARFDERGTTVLLGFEDHVVVINVVAEPKPVAQIVTDYVPTCACWIEAGQSIAVGGDDTRVRLYKVAPAK